MTKKNGFRQVLRESLWEEVALKLIGRPEERALTNQREFTTGGARRAFQAAGAPCAPSQREREGPASACLGRERERAWHGSPGTHGVAAIIHKDLGFAPQAVRHH